MGQEIPAGWYPDPAGTDGWRWWDGQRWTERVHIPAPAKRRGPRTAVAAGGGLALIVVAVVVVAAVNLGGGTSVEGQGSHEGGEPGDDEPGGDEPGGDEPGGDEPGGDEPGADEPETDPPPEISGDITMARANWDSGFFQAEVYYQLLEELGYTVEHPAENEMGAEIFYRSVGQGDVDFWANGWFPLHDDFLADAPNAQRVGIQAVAGAFQGYLADKATVEENDIESIEQIDDNPEHAALFDVDDDGVGDLVGCNNGWGCYQSIEEHFTESELGDNLAHVSAEYSSLMADTVARHERGEPVLYYTWMPSWVAGELVPGEDVVWLESSSHPDGQAPVPGGQLPGGPGACAAESPCDVGWAVNDIQVVANRDFLDDHPAAEALLEHVTLSPLRISKQNAGMQAGQDSRADIARHAQQWIEANRGTVDAWLEAARDAAG